MKITEKKYDEQRTYLEYDDNSKVFTNAQYFMFDIGSGTYEDCLACGGFYANMTWRHIKEKNLATVKYIMLCSIPQKNARFYFNFLYLDQDLNIQDRIPDNNFYDYTAFYNRFKELIVREGFVYELENTASLKEITEQFCYSPANNFGFAIDGKQIQVGDILVYKDVDLNIFKEEFRDILKRANAKDMILQFNTAAWSTESVNFSCKILDENGNAIKEYQAEGFADIDEYAESIYQEKADIIKKNNKTKEEWRTEWESRFDNRDYEFSLSFVYALSKIDHLSFYDKVFD